MSAVNENKNIKPKSTRSAPRYWIEIKGKVYARLQYKAENGKYKVKYRPISDKRTARRVVDAMRQELAVHGQEFFQSEKFGFAQLAEHYEARVLHEAEYSNGIKVSGRRSLLPVKTSLKALTEYFGTKPIRTIKSVDIESYKRSRLRTPTIAGTPRKIASVNRELELLRAMLNYAIRNEWLIKNPFVRTRGVISKGAEVERERVLTFEEERRLLDACVGQRSHLKALLICALDTAMRRGEIFKLRWADIKFERDEIFIPQTNTKTEESRTVGITPRLRAELDALREVSSGDKNQTVFGITTTIKTVFKVVCEEAKVRDFRFHDCRHTATTRMIASGCPHTEVMKITGHSQLKTFLRYLNITPESTNKVAMSLQAYISEIMPDAKMISKEVN